MISLIVLPHYGLLPVPLSRLNNEATERDTWKLPGGFDSEEAANEKARLE
jgi:hypothetical protein